MPGAPRSTIETGMPRTTSSRVPSTGSGAILLAPPPICPVNAQSLVTSNAPLTARPSAAGEQPVGPFTPPAPRTSVQPAIRMPPSPSTALPPGDGHMGPFVSLPLPPVPATIVTPAATTCEPRHDRPAAPAVDGAR